MNRMTPRHRDLLESYGCIAAMLNERARQHVEAMTDLRLAEFEDACKSASTTNVWCCAYEAAQWLLPHVEVELRHRANRRAAA
jgi:hypothetical protein